MVVKLIPDQIAELWDIIKYALEQAPPLMVDTADQRWLNKILEAAMSGQIDIWIGYTKTDEGNRFEAVGITSFEIDKFVKQKSLLIYYVYTFRDTQLDIWKEALLTVTKYAKSRRCTKVISYSDNEKIISLAKATNGNVDVRFITFDIGGD